MARRTSSSSNRRLTPEQLQQLTVRAHQVARQHGSTVNPLAPVDVTDMSSEADRRAYAEVTLLINKACTKPVEHKAQ